tara:strand:+ start:647 stop:3547 length:2901 start_codon:yes stop_codon:yes gene_type:complete
MNQNKIRIYDPIKNRFVKVNEFGATAKKLYKIYIDDLNTPAENVLPAGLKYNPETGYFTKTKEKKLEDTAYKNVKKLNFLDIFNSNKSDYSVVKNFMKQFRGKTIKVVSFFNGFIKYESIITISNNYSSWWKNSAFYDSFIMIDSEGGIFSPQANIVEGTEDNPVFKDPKNQGLLIVDTLNKINAEKYKQSFLDGITHCFFTPIKEWAIEKKENSETKSTVKKYNAMINKINKYEEQFKEGIPEDNIQSVADNLQIKIEVDIPSPFDRKVNLLTIEPQKKPLKTFKFLNTRINHIDVNNLTSLDKYEEVSSSEIESIKKKLSKDKEFYLYRVNADGISQLNTINKSYKITNEYQEIVSEFENNNNIKAFRINHYKNKGLSLFCKYSVRSNNTIDFIKHLKTYGAKNFNHIDMSKAYTKSHKCFCYEGILGKITDFRKTNKIHSIGLYQIYNIKFNGNDMIEKLGILHNNNIYPSPELKYYQSLGITFNISCGAWGTSTDINFGDGEKENTGMFKKINGVRVYCKWYGCLIKIDTNNYWRFSNCCEDYAKIMGYYNSLDDDSDYTNIYHGEGDFGVIEYKKRAVYHYSHIASFITSYQRLSMLEQLSKFKDFSQVARVCVDGIYFKGDVEVCDLFSYKEDKTFGNDPCRTYCEDNSNDGNYDIWEDDDYLGKDREHNLIEYHKGAGGTGKTHYNLTDKGLNSIVFISPSWKLARRKNEDYGVDSKCFYHLLTEDPDVWRPIYNNYSTLIIDEVSMMKDSEKNIIINKFNKHKIIFCGDVGFQLDPVYTAEDIKNRNLTAFKPEYNGKKIPTIEHNTMHRCKCPILKENLLMLRELIKKVGDKIDNKNLLDILKNVTIHDKDNIDYDIKDYIITKTHLLKDEYTEKYINLEKYYVMSKSRDYCNGDIVIGEKPKIVKSEIRHAFSIHSMQGETAEHKLFIDIRGINSLRMIYTAVSRSRYWNQIRFIK